jgi:CRISPR/Cas system CMR subunit Cmr4 (Cas7 group RAMP superfamily)
MPAEYYDFVPLPEQKKRAPDADALTHAELVGGRYSGHLDLRIVTKSPVHIGTGTYELSEDVGLEGGKVVMGMTKVAGEPVIPSSSLKGALRSVYEAITYSCVHRLKESAREDKWKLPQGLRDELRKKGHKGKKVPIQLGERALEGASTCKLENGERDLGELCPACSLFGTTSFQGRVSFEDARIIKMPKEPKESVPIPALYGPHLHKLGKPKVITEIRREEGEEKRRTLIEMQELNGRKMYYGVQLSQVEPRGQVLLDYLPEGTELCTRLHFHNLTLAELGGLLTAMGLNPRYEFPFRVGGGKPVGLGYISFELEGVHVLDEETMFTEFEPPAAKAPSAEECLSAFEKSEGELLFKKGLEKLCEIAERPYIPEEEGE